MIGRGVSASVPSEILRRLDDALKRMDYEKRAKSIQKEKLTDVQHEHGGVLDAVIHIHLDEDDCLESVQVRGSAVDVRHFAQELETRRGFKQLKLPPVTP